MKLELDMNEYLPLRDVVFKTLREAIIKGDLAPNERLMEIKLANMLGVSRTPVREAIRKLELEGLVIMNARRGAVVAPITKEDLIDVLDIRRAMERLGVELACQKITKDEIALLKKKNTEIEKAVEENDAQKIADLDVEFHEIINNSTKNKRLINIINGLKEHIYRYRLEYIKDIKVKEKIIEDHKRIIEAIESNDPKRAKKEIKNHIDVQEKFILDHLDDK